MQTWTLDDCSLLTVEIPPNSGRLYQYDGACYVRRGTNTVPLSVEEIDAFLKANSATRWEYEICPRATLDDINTEALERHLAYRAEENRARQRYSSPADLLLGLHAAVPDPLTGAIRPTHAGMLMFGYDPQLHLPQSEVVCIKYPDTQGIRTYMAGFLRDIPGYMERIGSGIRFMLREMEGLGLPQPEFTEHYDFVVTFRNGGKAATPDGLSERQLKALELGRVAGSINTSEYCAAN